MRKLQNALAPKSGKDMGAKIIGFIALFEIWRFAWMVGLRGVEVTDRLAFVIDGIVLILPFVLMAYFSLWHQLGILRSLSRRAKFDPLSELLNRQSFFSAMEKIPDRHSKGLMLLIDADHFKRINDTHGHGVGDICIEAIGHRLSWTLRDGAIAGRIGGEEFAVYIPDVNETQGKAIAKRIGQPVLFQSPANEGEIKVTLSIGGVWFDPDRDLKDLFIACDEALYRAKDSGRACLVLSNEPLPIPLDPLSKGPVAPEPAIEVYNVRRSA